MNKFWNVVEEKEEVGESKAPVYEPLRMLGRWVEECTDYDA